MLWRQPVLDGHDDDAKLMCPLQARVDPNSRDARHSNVEGTGPGRFITTTKERGTDNVRQIDNVGAQRVVLVGHSLAGLTLPGVAIGLGPRVRVDGRCSCRASCRPTESSDRRAPLRLKDDRIGVPAKSRLASAAVADRPACLLQPDDCCAAAVRPRSARHLSMDCMDGHTRGTNQTAAHERLS